MPQYLLSVHNTAAPVEDEAMQQMFADVGALNEKIRAAGAWVFAGGLEPADTARVVRLKPGSELLTTDGPYLEGKEYIGGFWIITAPDAEAAVHWAEQGAVACQGDVEVRPFQEDPA